MVAAFRRGKVVGEAPVPTAAGGIGEINTRGLRKEAGHWVNDRYETAPVKVRVSVQGGIGQITLIGDAP